MHGWINLDKTLHLTSARAVERVKRALITSPFTGEVAAQAAGGGVITNTPSLTLPRKGGGDIKVGHAGTLDPLATGILPIAVGEATKTVAFAMDKKKAYRFRLAWGEERSTDDAEGEVTNTSPIRPAGLEIQAILPQFTGDILQVPPAYSAIQKGGKRAYALARAGEQVELEARSVHIKSIELIENNDNYAEFAVACGKGTYIRSLARDIARKLAACGHVSMLRRTQVGPFDERGAISLEKLEELVHKWPVEDWLHPVESMLDDILAWEVDSETARSLTHGMRGILPQELRAAEGALIRAHYQGKLLAIVQVEGGAMKPVRGFNM